SRLPAHAPLGAGPLAELRSDLVEATEALAAGSESPAAAAQAATLEFGAVDEVAAAFRAELAVRQARRIGLVLLLSGPLIGMCWLVSVFLASAPTATAWRWLPLAITPVLLVGAPATAVTMVSSGPLACRLRVPSTVTGAAVAVA